jgi:hypothetical protein
MEEMRTFSFLDTQEAKVLAAASEAFFMRDLLEFRRFLGFLNHG